MPKLFAASEPRSSPLNMKTTKGLRARLEASAAASGRALTHEVEFRIEQALDLDREFGNREAAEIYHNIGRFLRLFNISAFKDETYLTRAGLKVAFDKFVDDALQDDSEKGALGIGKSPVINENRIKVVEDISSRLAKAVSLASYLDDKAKMLELYGEKAPRVGESMSEHATRIFPSDIAEPPAKSTRRRSRDATD